MSGSISRRPRLALVAALLAMLWLVLGAQAAAGHSLVRSSDPAAGASLERAPRVVTITFTEAPDPGLSTVHVLDQSGQQVESGKAATVAGKPLALQIPLRSLPDGSYTVSWRAVSRVDGHVSAGAFAFGVGAGAGTGPAVVAPGAEAGGETGGAEEPAPLAVAGRLGFFLGLVLLLGAAVTGGLVLGRRLPAGARVPLAGAWVLSAAGLVAMVLAQRSAVGVPLGDLLGSEAGRPLLAQGIALLAVAAATGVALARPAGAAPLGVLGGVTAAALLVHVVAGHAGGDDALRPLNVLAQWGHVTAVGVWIGGLTWLLLGLRRPRPAGGEGPGPAGGERPERVAAVARFSRLAGVALAVVAVTGLERAVDEVGSFGRLLGTSFGRTLLVKTGLIVVLVALGALNRFRLVPALVGGRGRLAWLRRTVRGEIGVALPILLAAALLGELPPAQFVADASPARRPPAVVTVQGNDFATSVRVTLTVAPGLPGPNAFTARVVDYDSAAPAPADRVSLQLDRPDRPEITGTVELARGTGGDWAARAPALSLAGRWDVTVLVQRGAGSVTVPLTLRTRLPAELEQVRASGPPPPDPADATVLGGQAGSTLVGLTAFQRAGTLVLRARGGIGIASPVVPSAVRLLGPGGRALAGDSRRCGDGCLETLLPAPPAARYRVEAALPTGTARFELPVPLPRPAAERLRAADRALAAAGSYRMRESLASGVGPVIHTDYALAGPASIQTHLTSGPDTAEMISIGEDRWRRENGGPWEYEPGVPPVQFPARNWSDSEVNVVDLGPAKVAGTPMRLIAFLDSAGGAYHRLWVGPGDRILRERMDAPGHFMTRDYLAYGQPVRITPPR